VLTIYEYITVFWNDFRFAKSFRFSLYLVS